MFYIWLQQIQHLSKVTTLLVKANSYRCRKLIFLQFRDRGLPGWLHLGALQPQEEQAAAHRQPEQEDHHLSGMVSREKKSFPFRFIEAEDKQTILWASSFSQQ